MDLFRKAVSLYNSIARRLGKSQVVYLFVVNNEGKGMNYWGTWLEESPKLQAALIESIKKITDQIVILKEPTYGKGDKGTET